MSRPQVVGRGSELQAVDRFLASIPEGPAALAITGEAGIGKTSVWREAVARARDASYVILDARPAASEEQLPFGALIDLLREVHDERLDDLPEPQREALEIALIRRSATGAKVESQAVSLAVLGTISGIAGDGPVVVAVDDVQWIDPATRRVIDFVSRRLRNEPVGFLTAERVTDDAAVPFPLDPAMHDERATLLSLSSLTASDLSTLIKERLGLQIGRAGSTRLNRISAGNPFFALEIATYLERRGLSLDVEDIALPPSLRHLVSERLGELGLSALEVTLVAAASSVPTTTTIAAVVEHAREGLAEAIDAGVLTVDGDRVALTHPLLASVVYSDAPASERRRVHDRLAEVTTGPEKARHLALATIGPDEEVAAALMDAARTTYARGASETAGDLAVKGARLTPPHLGAERSERMADAAIYVLESGDASTARDLFREAVQDAPDARVRATCRRGVALATFYLGELSAATRLFEQALDEADSAPDVAAACNEGMGIVAWIMGRGDDATRFARRARDIARTIDDRTLLAESSAEAAFFEAFLGQGIPQADMDAAIGLEERSRYVRIFRRPTFWNTYPILWLDDPAGARSVVENLVSEARRHGDLTSLPWSLVKLVETEVRVGDLDAASRDAEEAVALARELGQTYGLADALACKSLADGYLGRVDEATAAAASALETGERIGGFWARLRALWAYALIDTARGEHAAALGRLEGLPDRMHAGGFLEPAAWRFVPELVEALVAAGRVKDAVDILDPFEERARHLQRRWASAVAARSRAWIDFERGDRDSAFAHLDEASEIEAAAQQPLENARTMLARGILQRRSNRKKAARETLEKTAAAFDGLGARLWGDRARREIGRIGGRTSTAFELTATEQRVADLVSQGKSNPEIAEALYISRKTVEANLTRIYRKLSVRSRTELVRVLLDRPDGHAVSEG